MEVITTPGVPSLPRLFTNALLMLRYFSGAPLVLWRHFSYSQLALPVSSSPLWSTVGVESPRNPSPHLPTGRAASAVVASLLVASPPTSDGWTNSGIDPDGPEALKPGHNRGPQTETEVQPDRVVGGVVCCCCVMYYLGMYSLFGTLPRHGGFYEPVSYSQGRHSVNEH